MSLLGRATIKVNGKKLNTKRGATLDIGGPSAAPVVGSTAVHGFSYETTAPMLSVKITQTSDVGLTFVKNIQGATIVFEGDDGKTYTIDNGTCIGKPTLNEVEGEINAQFSGTSCTEVQSAS